MLARGHWHHVLECWEKYNWLRILYPRKIHIKNKIKYFLRHTTTIRLHHHQQTNVIKIFKRSQVRRNLKPSENLDLQGKWTVPKMINMQYVLKGKYKDFLVGPVVKDLLCNAKHLQMAKVCSFARGLISHMPLNN